MVTIKIKENTMDMIKEAWDRQHPMEKIGIRNRTNIINRILIDYIINNKKEE